MGALVSSAAVGDLVVLALDRRRVAVTGAAFAVLVAHRRRCPQVGTEWYGLSSAPRLDLQIAQTRTTWELTLFLAGSTRFHEVLTLRGHFDWYGEPVQQEVQLTAQADARAILSALQSFEQREWCQG